MNWMTVDDLRVDLGAKDILNGVQLSVARGSIVAVLGPSGCGKTTLLRAIAGLVPVSGGSIRIGDRDLNAAKVHVPAEHRGIGWVPQDASLFPHLSVGDNIGFGIRRDPQRTARISELAELIGLTGYMNRSPAQLSGGQAQRVSLARALAPRPDIVLLDEPFAALDSLLRTGLRNDVAQLLRSQRATALLVTHDQEEALSLADVVAVMMGGRIMQAGRPSEVYEQPKTPWVARFLGDTVELPGVWRDGVAECALGRPPARALDAVRAGDEVRVVLRPEWVRLSEEGVPAEVTDVAYAGHDALVTARLGCGEIVRSRVASHEMRAHGERVGVTLRRSALVYR